MVDYGSVTTVNLALIRRGISLCSVFHFLLATLHYIGANIMAGKITYPFDVQRTKRMQRKKAIRRREMLECEKMYVRIEMKFNMTNEDIRDRHQKFLAGQKSGEMNLQNFIEYAKKEKNMTAYLAESLFR